PVVLELRRRQRGCADEIHRKAECRIRKPVDVTRMWQTQDETFRGERGVGHNEAKLPGLAKRAEGRGETEDADVRFVAHVLQRQRRIGEHGARSVAVSGYAEIDTDRLVT